MKLTAQQTTDCIFGIFKLIDKNREGLWSEAREKREASLAFLAGKLAKSIGKDVMISEVCVLVS